MVPGVQMARSLTGLWGEFMGQSHGCVRVMEDSQGGISKVAHGMDNAKCASYKKAQVYAGDAVDHGVLWFDRVPGEHSPSDLLTKQVGNISEFKYKSGIMCGSKPFLYESESVLRILNRGPGKDAK